MRYYYIHGISNLTGEPLYSLDEVLKIMESHDDIYVTENNSGNIECVLINTLFGVKAFYPKSMDE